MALLTFYMDEVVSGVVALLRSRGINAKRKWVEETLVSGAKSPEDVLERFLNADIEETTECGPENQLSMNFMKPQMILEAPVIVQVNEVVDVSLPELERLEMKESSSPTLKLLLSDGDSIYGIVQRPIPGIKVGCAGVKVKISAGTIMRYGVFILNEENTLCLGGRSDKIAAAAEEARQWKPIGFRERVEEAMSLLPEPFSPELDITVGLPKFPETQTL